MRLTNHHSTVIDADQVVNFSFNGKALTGLKGDTLASALIANRVQFLSRSFKYGRKRGLVAAGVEEPNALVSLEAEGYYTPNIRATEIQLYEGLVAKSAIDTEQFDLRAALKPFHRFMPAGFYYKTFIIQKIWAKVEDHLRRLSGNSKSPTAPDSEAYEHQYDYCDVLVIGAGIAGMQATVDLIENQDLSVILVDERAQMGGEILSDIAFDDTAKTQYQQSRTTLEQQTLNNPDQLRMLQNTTAYSWLDDNTVLALEKVSDNQPIKQRRPNSFAKVLHKIRAKKIILATGAHERPMLFANNDLSHIMLAQSVRRYANEFGVVAGNNIVVYGNNNSIYEVAHDLLKHQLKVQVVDVRAQCDSPLVKKLQSKSVECHQGYAITAAQGKDQVESVTLQKTNYVNDQWQLIPVELSLNCDLLATSGGFNPVVHLDCHTGSKPVYNETYQTFMPVDERENRVVCGSIAGWSHWQDAQMDGHNKALTIIQSLTDGKPLSQQAPPLNQSLQISPFFTPDAILKSSHVFLDMQNDVTTKDVRLSITEGYQSIEHIKRYTAMGFGTDQGKTGNINGIAVAAALLKTPMSDIGTTTFRPAYTAVPFGALAGSGLKTFFEPERFTPIHASHVAHGAEFELVGQWYRPWYFPKNGEDMHQAVKRECLAAHTSLAMMDASTLGKIDIQGKDAREFLSRVYTNAWAKLPPGKCRYGIMLDEKGMISDDGVTACIDDNHFVMTTTTGGAAGVYSTLEMWLQTEWTDLEVYLTSVTDHFSTIAVVGPDARNCMKTLCSDVDFDRSAFKFMEWRQGTVCGVPARIMRISFSGELAYEINVEANYGKAIWDQVYEQGQPWNITPYGTEAMHVLRAEKGYIIVGQDTDGSVTPVDANMSWILAAKKDFSYIGKRSLTLPALTKDKRKQLVGLHTVDESGFVLPEGTHLVNNNNQSIGHVTSSYYSAVLKRSIAMALVKDGLNRMDDVIKASIVQPYKKTVECQIVSSVFYDPKGENVDGND